MKYRVYVCNDAVQEFPTLEAALSYAVRKVYMSQLYPSYSFLRFHAGEVDHFSYGYGFAAVTITRLKEAA